MNEKRIRWFFGIFAALIILISGAVVVSSHRVSNLGAEGFAMPSSANVNRNITSSEGSYVDLTPVKDDDEIVTLLGKTFLRVNRQSIDLTYPIWMNDFAGLRFINDEIWLVTDELEPLTSFEGMYVTEGNTYTVDKVQADSEEFILVRVGNGLYINAQSTDVDTMLGSYHIPSNSILKLEEKKISWMEPNGDALVSGMTSGMTNAEITIGNNTYEYGHLLKALGILNDAIDAKEKGDQAAADELVEEAAETAQKVVSRRESQGTNQTAANAAQQTLDADAANNAAGNNGTTGNTDTQNANGAANTADNTAGGASDGVAKDGGGTDGGNGGGMSGDDTGGFSADGNDGVVSADQGNIDSSPVSGGSIPSGSNPGSGSSSSGVSGSSGSSTGSQNKDEDDEGGNENDDDNDDRGDGETDDGDSSGIGKPGIPVYHEPSVQLHDVQMWSYALNGQLLIHDIDGNISKGVKVAVYRALKEGKPTGETYMGLPTWTAEKGTRAVTRKTYSSYKEGVDNEITISPLPPDSTLYAQVTYKYTNEEGKRVTYSSPFIEIRTDDVGALEPVQADWKVAYASDPNAITLENFTLANTTNYRPDDPDFDNFRQNILPYVNSITLTMTKVGAPADEKPVEIVVPGATLRAAQSGATVFISGGKLDSNAEYTFKASAYDRFSHDYEIPLIVNQQTGGINGEYTGRVYTQKTKPTAVVSVENIDGLSGNTTGKLNLKVTIKDPDNSLADYGSAKQPLYFTAMKAGASSYSVLEGYWDGNENKPLSQQLNLTQLPLENPANGKTYHFTLTSLPFARTFTMDVSGKYEPNPDAAALSGEDPLSTVDAVFGSARVYTASLASGRINFDVPARTKKPLDFSATLELNMSNNNTTAGILDYVDEYRLKIMDTRNNALRVNAVLNKRALSAPITQEMLDANYIQNENCMTLIRSSNYTLSLVGSSANMLGKSVWELINATEKDDGSLAPGSALRLNILTGLKSSTPHTVIVQSVAIKGDEEYTVRTDVTNGTFTTKKVQPTIEMDLFAASGVLELQHMFIRDVDGTILTNESTGRADVKIKLYTVKNGAAQNLIDIKTVQPGITYDGDENSEHPTVTFENIVAGAEYQLIFEAPDFNDEETANGYVPNKVLFESPYTFVGNGTIDASVKVVGLEYSAMAENANRHIHRISGESIRADLENTSAPAYQKWVKSNFFSTAYKSWLSPVYPLSELTEDGTIPTFLDLAELAPTRIDPDCVWTIADWPGESYIRIQFYGDLKGTSATGYSTKNTHDCSDWMAKVPAGSVGYRFVLPHEIEELTERGITFSAYTTQQVNWVATMKDNTVANTYINATTGKYENNSNYRLIPMIPVEPGQVYYTECCYGVCFYDANGAYIGKHDYVYNVNSARLVIPQNVRYMSFLLHNSNYGSAWLSPVLTDTGLDDSGYTASYQLHLVDQGGILELDNPGKTPTATLTIYSTDMLRNVTDDDYSLVPGIESKVVQLEKTPGETAAWQLKDEFVFGKYSQLAADKSYQLRLSVRYQNRDITLATTTFMTDGPYVLIHNNREFLQIQRNKFANYLVVEDFDHDLTRIAGVTINGTIDFQGHTVTRKSNPYIAADPSRFSNYLIQQIGATGAVRNARYVYDEGLQNNEYRNFVYNNYGLMENIMLEIPGHIQPSSGLLCYCNRRGGVIRNFVVKITGDVYIPQNCTLIGPSANYGLVENGYVYTTNNAGIILESGSGMVMRYNREGTVRNIFVLADVYSKAMDATSEPGGIFFHNYDGLCENIYSVGNFYSYSGNQESYTKGNNPMSVHALLSNTYNQSGQKNLYYITDYDYANPKTSIYATQRERPILWDAGWQADLLGSAFDAEHCVNMGFYPRLNMPDCMQRLQEYLPLDSQSTMDQPPAIVNDGMETDIFAKEPSERGSVSDSGIIYLLMENYRNYKITNLTIDNLLVTEESILSQEKITSTDGKHSLVKVRVSVSVDPEDPQYLSNYTVRQITYSRGTTQYTVESNYVTQNISFWKEIKTTEDWKMINGNGTNVGKKGNDGKNIVTQMTNTNRTMTWNYRLMNDIDFEDVTNRYEIIIDGHLKARSSNTFAGQISGLRPDGGRYALKNINITGDTPYVIYSLQRTRSGIQYIHSGIYDLDVENMNITVENVTSEPYCGFIRSGITTADNVHFKDCTLNGAGRMGMLLGYSDQFTMSRCSVVHSELNDEDLKANLYCGGLIGYINRGSIEKCFTCDVDINVDNAITVKGVGGMVGWLDKAQVRDSYTKGEINVVGNYVGGILGYGGENSVAVNCWSYVNIVADGNYVGGIAGSASNRHAGVIALGNVTASGSDVNRINGFCGDTTPTTTSAYRAQIVSGIVENENDPKAIFGDAKYLFDKKELTQKANWANYVQLGDNFDLSWTAEKECPLIKGVDGQEPVALPGYDTVPTMEITQSSYNAGKLYFTFKLNHPGTDTADVVAKFAENCATENGNTYFTNDLSGVHLAIDGMDLSAINFRAGKVSLTTEAGDGTKDKNEDTGLVEATYGTVTIHQPEGNDGILKKMMDSYTVMLYYPADAQKPVQAAVRFDDYDCYWQISNLVEWNDLMTRDNGVHQTSAENIRITGVIDFDNGSTSYVGLKIGKLVGNGEYTYKGQQLKAGFYNLHYEDEHKVWIDMVKTNVENLAFANIKVDYSNVLETWGTSGLIGYTTKVNYCSFENITIEANAKSCKYLGFFGTIEEGTTDITMKDITVRTGAKDSGSYIGGLAGVVNYGPMKADKQEYGIIAEDIHVEALGSNYVGGIIGHQGYRSGVDMNSSIYIHGTGEGENINYCTVQGKSHVGSVAGYCMTATSKALVNKVQVTGNYNVGGYASYPRTEYMHYNITVQNSEVTAQAQSAQQGCGGISYRMYRLQNATVANTRITAYGGAVGGLAGIGGYQSYDCYVVDCVISQQGSGAETDRAGGILGEITVWNPNQFYGCVVANTTVESSGYAGGLVGYADMSRIPDINRSYVWRDVTVTGQLGAGGLLGKTYGTNIKNSASGATVNAKNNAGGMVGVIYVGSTEDLPDLTIQNSYYKGNVTAEKSYAGGLVGKIETTRLKADKSKVTGAVIAGSVTAADKAGPWMNNNGDGVTGDAAIYICEDLTVNNQKISSIVQAQNATGIRTQRLPDSMQLVSPARLAQASFYETTWAIPKKNPCWTVEHMKVSGNKYMPYITDRTAYTVNTLAQFGILLPEVPEDDFREMNIYPSGADTVNVELHLTGTVPQSVTVQLNGADLQLERIGGVPADAGKNETGSSYWAATVRYNYRDDLKAVYGATQVDKSAQALRHEVMTYRGSWYYISRAEADAGKVHYGPDNAQEDLEFVSYVPLPEGTTALHLWQGRVLASDESNNLHLYALGEILTDTPFTGNLTKTGLRPMASYTVAINGKDTTMGVYGYCTLMNGEKKQLLDQRLFVSGGITYSVTPNADAQADGIIMSSGKTGARVESFLAVLQDGSIRSYAAAMQKPSVFVNSGILEITNNFEYDGTVVLIRYGNGIIGFDYANGAEVVNTLTALETAQFFATAKLHALLGRFDLNALSGTASLTREEAEYVDHSYTAVPLNPVKDGAAASGTGSRPGTAEEEGNAMMPGIISGENIPGTETGGTSTSMNGQQGQDGSNTLNGEGTDKLTEGSPDSMGDADGKGSQTVYVIGMGIYENGKLAVEESRVTKYVPSEGVYVDGELAYTEAPGGTYTVAESQFSPSGSQILQVFGRKVVALDSKTGEAEVKDTRKLLERENKTEPEAPNAAERDLSITQGFSRNTFLKESNGFTLLGTTILSAAAILVIYYLIMRKKRK